MSIINYPVESTCRCIYCVCVDWILFLLCPVLMNCLLVLVCRYMFGFFSIDTQSQWIVYWGWPVNISTVVLFLYSLIDVHANEWSFRVDLLISIVECCSVPMNCLMGLTLRYLVFVGYLSNWSNVPFTCLLWLTYKYIVFVVVLQMNCLLELTYRYLV